MNRCVFCFAAVFVGCVASIPHGDTSITADLACEASRMIVQARQGMPPTPTPASDDCERCGGTGYIGDQASIRIKCSTCKGTGKKPKATCTTGSCSLP